MDKSYTKGVTLLGRECYALLEDTIGELFLFSTLLEDPIVEVSPLAITIRICRCGGRRLFLSHQSRCMPELTWKITVQFTAGRFWLIHTKFRLI
jgi:hypothetical protein